MAGAQVVAPNLCRQEHLITWTRPRPERTPDDFLGRPVGFRRVDQRHATLEGVVDGVDRLTLIDRAHTAADRPRAEADDRHAWSGVAELSLLHACPLQMHDTNWASQNSRRRAAQDGRVSF